MSTTNILDLNNRIDALEKNSGGGSADSAKRSDIATEFSATTAYTAGCFVYYEGKLYQFNADHSAGAWDPTDVVEANVTDQIVSNKAAIEGLTASDIMMSDGVTSLEDAIEALNQETIISITADGVKTYGQYFTELYNAIHNYNGVRKQTLTLQIGPRIFNLSLFNNLVGGEYQFSMFAVGSHVYSRGAVLAASVSDCGYKLATDTTITDMINEVPTSSEIMTVYQ